MDCSQCGARAQPGQRFCGQCGRPLAVACPDCGHENPAEHRFCGACGASLTADAPPVDRPAEERRVVSVLFCDLVGFTSLSEDRDPEEVREVITEYFELAREVIDRFGGTVDKFIGDAVMAWWGATTSREDDAERAVRAGLELVDRVSSLERPGLPALQARAGVMTGEVSVGPGGNERGLILGDLVNAASRLQSLAEPASVFVGDATASLIDKAIELIPAGTHQVKGREAPITAHRAVRVVSERGGRGRADTLEPPFVGRASELRLLKDSLHATGREQRARLVSLVGQAGIGKSRLIWEFQKYLDGLVETVYWHHGRSPAYGDGVALWALGEMIRVRAGIGETDSDDVTAERLAAAVAEHVDEAAAGWVTERLSALLGVGESVGTERSELFAAARAFFEGISRKGTVALIFEDLHWADPALLEFIEELPDWSQNHPILVVTVARPDLLDRRPDWGSGRRGFASLYLGPLADGEMAELVSGAVPGIPQPAVERIVAAADGVPLFAVEMLRTLLSDGRLVARDGTVEVSGDLDSLEVPSSVQAVISARIDRLPTAEREVARDAAVLGQSFTLEGLAAVREEEPDKLQRRLADMVRHEILELVRDPRSPERGQYRWVQSLLREVAYGRVSRTQRHQLHLRAARYFRDLDDPELAPIALSHYLAASDHGADPELETEVVEALRAAIARAQAIHAHEQLLALVDAALEVVPPDVEVELREIGAHAAVRLNDLETADLHAERLMDLAEASTDPALTHLAVALLGQVANETRRSERARSTLEAHLEANPDLASDPNLARAAVYLARAQLLAGEDRAAAATADEALAAVERLGLVDEVADAMITRGTALAGERVHQGMALLRGAVGIAREHDLLGTKLRALINIGYASPELDEAHDATREAFEESKRVGDRNHATFVAGNLLGYYMSVMDHDAAEALLADPVLTDTPHDLAGRYAAEADVRFRRGDLETADELLAAARALADDVIDVQAQMNLERTEGLRAFLQHDYRTLFDIAHRHYRDTPFAPALAVGMASAAAAMDGDPELLDVTSEMAASLPPGGFWVGARPRVEAVRAVTSGEVDTGIAIADRSIAELSSKGLRWAWFLTCAAVARHLPRDHEARQRYLDQGLALAEEAGAPGLAAWIEQAAS